jgi:hypothetical protein
MRRIGKSLALCLLLLLTQHGAVVHELTHVLRANTEVAAADGSERMEASCALCPAFAQVVTPAFTHSLQIPALERHAPQRSAAPRFTAIDATIPQPRSRGPPSLS